MNGQEKGPKGQQAVAQGGPEGQPEGSAQGGPEKKRDVKFIVGMIILAAMLVFMGGGFWTMVMRQAEMDKARELEEEAYAIRAICLKAGEGGADPLLWDMEDSYEFQAVMPSGVVNRKGALIRGDFLEYGDMVRILGGNMKEGEIPVLENITRMERLGRATLEEASAYEKAREAFLSGEELPGPGPEGTDEGLQEKEGPSLMDALQVTAGETAPEGQQGGQTMGQPTGQPAEQEEQPEEEK